MENYFGIYVILGLGINANEGPRCPQDTRVRLGLVARPGGLWALWAPVCVDYKIIIRKFYRVWISFDIDFLRYKKHAKTRTVTR